MPTIDCDVSEARARLADAGYEIEQGNTDHEQWRVSTDDATAVAYDDTVVLQGARPDRLRAVIEEAGGRAHCYFDGAARGNPGPAAVGWVIVTNDGIVADGGERLGTATNNQAEYEALIRVLEVAAEYGFDTAHLRGDSELIVKQVQGAYDVNDPTLQEHRVRVHELLARFDDWSIQHVPREINERADELANEALDNG